MQDEDKAPTESAELTTVEAVEVVDSPLLEVKPNTPYHIRSPQLAAQIRDLASLGISKLTTAITARISVYILEKYYLNDFLEGQSRLHRNLAGKAVEEALEGNTPVLIHLLKTKLGWNETQVVEHTGEVRSVVSSRPLSQEEFVRRFITDTEDT